MTVTCDDNENQALSTSTGSTKACTKPEIQKIAKSAGLFPLGKNERKELKRLHCVITNIDIVPQMAQETNSMNGNVNHEHHNFVTTVLSASVDKCIGIDNAPSCTVHHSWSKCWV